MTNSVQSCSQSTVGLSCPCKCERCLITELSKLDRELLPYIKEPKYRNCEPCNKKYDLILRRGSKNSRCPPSGAKHKMVETHELIPLFNYTAKTNHPSTPKIPVIESPGAGLSDSDIDVSREPADKGSQLSGPSLVTLIGPATPETFSNDPITTSRETKDTTIAQAPAKIATFDLDSAKTLGKSEIPGEDMDRVERKVSIGPVKQGSYKATFKEYTVDPSDRAEASGRKVVTIRTRITRSATPAHGGLRKDRSMVGKVRRDERRSPSCSYGFSGHSVRSKMPSTSLGMSSPKGSSPIKSSFGEIDSRQATGHYKIKPLVSLVSRSVDELLTKPGTVGARPRRRLSANVRSNSRSPSDFENRKPWYPLRSTNRWEHYDKLDPSPSTISKTSRAKLARSKSNGLSKAKSLNMSSRYEDAAPEYADPPKMRRNVKSKALKMTHRSESPFKPGMQDMRSDSLMYYRLKGTLKPHRPSAQEEAIHPVRGHASQHSKAKMPHAVRRICDVHRCSTAFNSDSERTCYASEVYSCECFDSSTNNYESKCCYDDCNANLRPMTGYLIGDGTSVCCEDCNVAPLSPCHEGRPGINDNACCGVNAGSVTQVISNDCQDSVRWCSVYDTESPGTFCWDECNGVHASGPCYVKGKMKMSRTPCNAPSRFTKQFNSTTCCDNNFAVPCGCCSSEALPIEADTGLSASFGRHCRVTTPTTRIPCHIYGYR